LVYSVKELEHINNHIKENPNFELVDRKLVNIPYTPILIEAIKHEIARQLGNWNLEGSKSKAGIVTTSKGGFDFNVSDGQKIRAPSVAFTPSNICNSLDEKQLWSFQGQPFTPIFVVEVANITSAAVEKYIDTKIKKDYFADGTCVMLGWLIDPINFTIWAYKRNKNGAPYRRKQKWEDLDGGEILKGFKLELWMINHLISQVYFYNIYI
jgi:Uma2 family endonuclease